MALYEDRKDAENRIRLSEGGIDSIVFGTERVIDTLAFESRI